MKRFPLLISIAATVGWLLPVVGPFAASARASVITIGDVVPGGATTQSDPWAVGSSLKVGDSGNGMLNVEAAGMVSSTKGYIGYQSGSTGEATITGADSQWNNSSKLLVGIGGTGTLNIEVGGVVANTNGYLGYHAGSTGKATVTGTGSQWNNSDRLVVGRSGDGTLIVEAEGVVSNNLSLIGRYSSSTGVVTVTGANSQWNNSGGLHVGWYGNGTLNVKAGGMASNTSGYIGRYSGSTGEATVTDADSQWNNSNSLYIGGGSSGSGGSGTLNLNNSGLATVLGTTKLWSDGTINLDGGTLDVGTLDLTLGTFNMLDGSLHADHVIGDLYNQAGTLTPGNRPGIMAIADNYIQGANATMEIELGGTVRGDEHDAMIVDGNLTLDGSLNVLAIGGFVPQAGDLFDIFDFEPANLSGLFDAVNLPDLASDMEWDQTNLYTTGELLVSLSQIAGDFDSDGDVDGDDFLLWQRNFPVFDGTASLSNGDANGDGDVNGNDFLVWQRNFPYPTAISSVPEPNSLALLALGGLVALHRRTTR